ncbi:MAG: hypothetical protein QM706_07950 [Nitrospira sp.]
MGSCLGIFVAGESCGSMAIPGSMTGGCTEDLGWGSVGGVTTIPGSIVGRFASGAGGVSGGGEEQVFRQVKDWVEAAGEG